MDYDHGDPRKRKPNSDEGMTRDDQGGRARMSGATDPMTMGMERRQREYLTMTDTGGEHNNEEDENGEQQGGTTTRRPGRITRVFRGSFFCFLSFIVFVAPSLAACEGG